MLLSAFFTPFILTAAMIRSAQALTDSPQGALETLRRTALRLLGVAIVNFFVVWLCLGFGVTLMMTGDFAEVLMGFATLATSCTLLYALVYVCVEPPSWALPFLAVTRSIELTWQNANVRRLVLPALLFTALVAAETALQQWLTAGHVRDATFLAGTPADALTAAPFAVLLTVIYFDALARESRRAT